MTVFYYSDLSAWVGKRVQKMFACEALFFQHFCTPYPHSFLPASWPDEDGDDDCVWCVV